MGGLLMSLLLIAQDPRPTFTVGDATAARAQTAYGAITVAATTDSGLNVPVAVIHGARPGKVVAFVAGSHGTEYASIVALQRLIPRIDACGRRLTLQVADRGNRIGVAHRHHRHALDERRTVGGLENARVRRTILMTSGSSARSDGRQLSRGA